MLITFGNLFLIIILSILVGIIAFTITLALNKSKLTMLLSTIFATIGTALCIIAFCSWYNGHTAAGVRAYKDFRSNLENGINREIIITAEDGREIFRYDGKVDVELNHEDNYIKFESEDGKRYIIYYGIQDTIMIVEK